MARGLRQYFLSCLLLLPIFITGTAAAQEKIKAGISSFSASYISMFIANKRGYYAEEGMSSGHHSDCRSSRHTSTHRRQRRVRLGQQPHGRRPRGKTEDADGLQREASLRAVRATLDQVGGRVARQANRWLYRGESGIWLDQRAATEIWFAARSRRDFSAHRSHRDPLHGSKNRHSRRHAAGTPVQFTRPGCGLSRVDPGVRARRRYSSLHRDNRRTAGAPERDGAALLEGHSERTAGLSGSA